MLRQISPPKISLHTSIAIGLLLLGLVLRLYDLTDPPFDFHPTRQLRSAIIARGMYYQMLPGADPSTRDKAIGLWGTMEAYEPPILERLIAFTYLFTGEKVWVGRIFTSIAWILGGWALFDLVKRLVSSQAALFSLSFYLVLPFAVVASRSFQPDPLMVSLTIWTAWGLERWGKTDGASWWYAILAGAFAGLAMLFKVYAVFPTAAMAVGMMLGSRRISTYLRRPQTWVFAAISALVPASYYLFNIGSRSAEFALFWTVGLSDLLRQSKFYVKWLAMIRGLLEQGIFFIALAGAFLYQGKGRGLALGCWAGYFLIGLTFPFQIYSHEYYSLLLVPTVAIGFAPLVEAGLDRLGYQPRLWQVASLAVVVGVLGYTAWVSRSILTAEDWRKEPIPWQRMGQELPVDGPMIGLVHDYGNRLKYYGWRTVDRFWPASADFGLSEAAGSQKISGDFKEYFNAQTNGMSYFLVTLFSDLNAQPTLKAELETRPIARKGDGYILYDLRPKK